MPFPFCDRCKTLVDLSTGRCPKCRSQQAIAKHETERPKKRATAHSVSQGHGTFPYPYRPYQEQFVTEAKDALAGGKHIVIESGTGTGKTICSLVASLDLAKESGRKVVYLNRTNSQSDQVMQELRTIARRRKVVGLPLTGRAKSCLFMREAEMTGNIPPSALSKFCEEKKKRTKAGKEGGCGYYANLIKMSDGTFENYLAQELPSAQEFDDYCADEGVCPYECRKLLAPKADVIIAPYVHVLSEDLREQFLDRIGVGLDGILLVVDEAHNLIESARESESFGLGMMELDAGDKELKAKAEEEVGHGITLGELSSALIDIITTAANEQLPSGHSEAELGKRFLEGELARRLELNVEQVRTLGVNTFNLGQAIAEEKLEEGNDPTSITLLIGRFLTSWFSVNDKAFVKLVSSRSGGSLEAVNLEPEELEVFLAACPAALHMSGTLQPLQQYSEVAGLPDDHVMRTYPSPFPPENRLVLYTPDLNPAFEVMRNDPTMQERIGARIIELCSSVNVSTMVFFRSYELLRRFQPSLQEGITRRKYWDVELSGNSFNRAVQDFKDRPGGVFMTVMGGRVSEGLDFPGKQLEMAIMVGLPYPPPSLANRKLQELYDRKYGRGKGWEYAQEAPALRKVQQAIGRLIRTETDRGAAIILDSRVSKYAEQLGAKKAVDPVEVVQAFFSVRNRQY
ncbi:MAG: ATP-dependent DNA helicase [Methanomassiliicoccales archaeon PtaU1.Bin124]|nr:MAG: ATP-dependent DNA helicase [Methanomassiliicoccales archaeon PtaU1.Bin124]